MKKPIVVFALLAGAVSAHAQGTIFLSDYIASSTNAFCIDVFSPQHSNPTIQMTGNTIVDLPTGTVGIGPATNEYQGPTLGGSSGGSNRCRFGWIPIPTHHCP